MNVLFSGGAKGADFIFDLCAKQAGHACKNFSFDGHRCLTSTKVVLTQEELFMADDYLLKANETVRRTFKKGVISYSYNLLRRNWYQSVADSIYVISSLDTSGSITGGSAWATQCFIDRHNNQPCFAYLFDQNTSSWYKWEGSWIVCEDVPKVVGIYAGIGTRDLQSNGREAIERLYG